MDIKYLNRQGEELIEKAPGSKFMSFLYSSHPVGRVVLWGLVRRKMMTIWFGKYMSSEKSQKRITPFIEQHKMDMSAYIEPAGGYQHFNDFFYRKIKPETRPIANGLVSPADGRVALVENVSENSSFYIKGKEFQLADFLDDENLAKEYENGSMVIVRLAPVDYHRYHFPAAGKVGKTKIINGHYYSVSPIALRKNWKYFWQNKRSICILQTQEYGDLIISEVAATLTGGIVSTHAPNIEVQKGDEKGHFAFGGSTVIIIAKQGQVQWDEDLLNNSRVGIETYLKMGERIGKELLEP